VPAGDAVSIDLVVIAGTRRSDRLASLDTSGFVTLDMRGRASSIALDTFVALSDADIRSAFSGAGGLADVWRPAGAGAVQQVGITLRFEQRRLSAYCERREVCVDGHWQAQHGWRSQERGSPETIRDQTTVSGNLEAGLGRGEDESLAQIVAFFVRVQGRVRALQREAEQLDAYRKDCRAGRR
jgi:hypothetical protein